MRLILISLGTLFTLLLVGLSIRIWGLSKPPTAFQHPWREIEKPWVIVPQSVALQLPAEIQTKLVAQIYVYASRNGDLFAIDSETAPRNTGEETKILQSARPLNITLNELKGRRVLLNILSNSENIDIKISDLAFPLLGEQVLVQSPFDVILRSIKKLQPLWLYGTSQTDRVRFRFFESLWLLPAAPFSGDVWIPTYGNMEFETSNDMMVEFKRRNKMVILGPFPSNEQLALALGRDPDGVFIDRPGQVELALKR